MFAKEGESIYGQSENFATMRYYLLELSKAVTDGGENYGVFIISSNMKKKNKTNTECLNYLKEKWRSTLLKRFDFFIKYSPRSADHMNSIINAIIQTLENIFLDFSGLKDTQFNTEIMSSDEGVYEQRMAEMLFFARLKSMGFTDLQSDDAGPDFFAKKNDMEFCFEIVTPTPKQAIRDLINKPEWNIGERDLVFKERLLSVTSCIDGKLKGLIRHKKNFKGNDVKYIIVINDSLLLPYNKPWFGAMENLCFGDSTLPIVVDATVGSADVEISSNPSVLENNSNDKRKIIVKGNISVSVNGGKARRSSDSTLFVNTRREIPTRDKTNVINVNLLESTHANGFYQITLREDLFFFHVFSFSRQVMPHSALIAPSDNSTSLKTAIMHTSFYSSDNDLVQPPISPALLLGRKTDEFNNEAIYNKYFKPVVDKPN